MIAEASGLPSRSEARNVSVALLGRPNAGKSSLYNAVTGGNAKVGNFPGITVDVLEAPMTLPSGTRARFLDLPGVYSLGDEVDPDSDEGQARATLAALDERGDPFLIAQVIDATQLVLGLRLTRDVLARGWPVMVVVTQRDMLEKSGGKLDVTVLEKEIGVPVIAVSALDRDVKKRVLAAVDAMQNDLAKPATRDFDARALASRAVKRTPGKNATERADEILLHPILGPIVFVAIMTALFSAVFLVADPASNALDAIMSKGSSWITKTFGVHWWTSLIGDGILGGAGTVLAFLPQIVVLTIALELIDASGYLARGAFLVDRVLRLAGLGGKSFVPLLTAHACAVPAIAATRIVRDPKQRLRTLLVLPLMTCSARIPTYGLIIAAFFRHRSALFQAFVFVCLYSAGILAGFFASLVIGKMTEKRGSRSLPLVLEMPAYRMPQPKVIARMALTASTRFLKEVGTVIVLASLGLWALLKVGIAEKVGHAMEPLTRPLGFDWKINVGLIGSFGARELMVSTLGVTYGVEQTGKDADVTSLADRIGRDPAYTTATALALMAFFVLACQCMSTVAALRRETKGWKVPAFVVAYTYVAAYVAAFVVHAIASRV
ncbi:MAG TPA: ferrous iron transporter B [Polyangiaceae bacterium]|jgi:ferrous iron transport protein B|nr:ferrous iron transporter B [Polyangiaceae bacterium]